MNKLLLKKNQVSFSHNNWRVSVSGRKADLILKGAFAALVLAGIAWLIRPSSN